MTTIEPIGLTGQYASALLENDTVFYDNITVLSTTTESYGHEKHFTEYSEYKAAHFINRYYLYAVCAIGIPGNVACIVTLLFMRPMVSSAVYMTALAIVDTIAISLKMIYFQLTAYDIRLGDRGCQVIFLTGTISQQYSNWILVAMTVERFIAVCFPFKVKTFLTKTKALVTSIALLIVFTLANLQFMFTFEEVNDPYLSWDCRPQQKFKKFVQFIWYWIDGSLYAILPILIVVALNGLMICSIRKANENQRDLTSRAVAPTDKMTQQRQITMMLMTISIVFVLLVLPNCIFFIVREYWSWGETMKGIAQYYLFYQIVFLLSDFNHAVNFYLYCLSGRKFRRKFISLICCQRAKSRQNRLSYASSPTRNRVLNKMSGTLFSNVSEMFHKRVVVTQPVADVNRTIGGHM